MDLPTYEDVEEASRILEGISNRTPVHTSRTLDEELGVKVYVKCENYQRMGAFKFRGGYNAVRHLTSGKNETSAVSVLTYSSGNHAQAIALSSKILGVKSTIIMPKDAPQLKVNATMGYGGNVIFYDRYKEDREEVASKVRQEEEKKSETTMSFIPPYDHKHVIAGQGTAGKELIEEVLLNDGGGQLDYLFVCVGGGGLISGCALAADKLIPNCKVIGVEPEAGNDAQQSLQKNHIVHIDTPQTIADGAQTQHIGKLTFRIMKKHVEKIITVSDKELIECMKFFGERMKMIVEPTGCLGLAGLKKLVNAGEISKGSKCGVIISGGNVDMTRYCELISTSSP